MTKPKTQTITAPDKAKPRKSVKKPLKKGISEGITTKTPGATDIVRFDDNGEVIRELKKLPTQLPVYIVRDGTLSQIRFVGIGNAREDVTVCSAVVIF